MSSLSYAVNESATVIDIEQRRAEYMGNPQLDDGHTRIANELFEAILRSDLSSVQLKVALCVIRKTYGFNKKADRLAQSVIAEMTNVAKPNVCRAIKQLSKMKVVLVDTTKFPHEISINKRYKEWSNSYQSDNSYQVDSYQNDNEKVINSITKPLSIQQPQKKERKKEKDIAIPAWISTESWSGFVQMRKSIKKPLSERAMALVIKKLSDFRDQGYSPDEILDQSTMNNWQGVFETKTKPVAKDEPNAMVTLPDGSQISREHQKWLAEMMR